MTGQELQQLIVNKWGYSFDVQFRRVRDKIFLQVMWRYLEQASFPLSEEEYIEHLNAVSSYLQAWGSTEQVKEYIANTKERPRLGKVVNIPLDLGERTSEWIVED
jgi:hypothetical protein